MNMISKQMKKRLDLLAKNQADYQPSRAVVEQLSHKTLVMLISATSMGKSTILRELHAQDDSIAVVGTITTRPPRDDDDISRYTFYEHTDAGLAPLLDAIEHGDLIQYVINPYNGFVYGSSLQDYPSDVSIGDYFSSVVDDFKSYGFKKIIPLSVITEPDSWLTRFDRRFPEGHPDREARRSEAIVSLNWSLNHPEVCWIINRDGKSQAAIDAVVAIIRGNIDQTEQAEGIELAKVCLKTIRELA